MANAKLSAEFTRALNRGEFSEHELTSLAFHLIEQLEHMREVDRLETIGILAREAKIRAAQAKYHVGTYVLCDFNTRGLHLGIITKKNPKRFNVLLLTPGMGFKRPIPRNNRRWRLTASCFQRMVPKQEAEEKWKDELQTEAQLHTDHKDWFGKAL